MSTDEEKNKIEELKLSLYSRASPDVRTRRKLRFSDTVNSVNTAWKDDAGVDQEPLSDIPYRDHSMSFLKKVLIASIAFCVVAVGIGTYIFFNGTNFISANNIDIKINGPVSIPGGDPVSFDVVITNKNTVDLQSVDLMVTFPAGAIDPQDFVTELKQHSKFIGNLSTGGTVREGIQAIIFGEENVQKEILVTLTYGIKGSTAVFTKTQTYQVLINSSPISVTANSFKEVTSGQEFDIKVDVKSNSAQVLRNVLLTSSYPPGFEFISSTVRPASADNNLWKIGDMPPGSEKIITIHGRLQGENSDAKSFRFSVGAADNSNANIIGTQYMSLQQDITLQKPFISLNVYVNNDNETSDFMGDFNRSHSVDIYWFNNLPVPVTNAEIVIHLSGGAYSKDTVSPGSGYFRSATNDIIWSPQNEPALASIDAGGTGHVSFSLIPKDSSSDSLSVINPKIVISAGVSADRSQESQVPLSLTSIASRTIRISSAPALTSRLVRTTGPFANTGPIPPQAEKKTTYTVDWSVNNTSNVISGAKVVATLPAYVKWTGNVSPSSESVDFDQNTGIVTWNIGSLSTYTAGSSRRRQVYFQVSFEPGVDLADQIPILVNQATFTGVDNYTGVTLTDSHDILTTSFSTDPAFKSTDSIVVR